MKHPEVYSRLLLVGTEFDFFINPFIDECRRMALGGKQNNEVGNKLGNSIITLETLGKVQN
uniref:Uncharacterized protein n=1 Tax=Dromaius novaehollandiae TaxID=8790 RepID=A0A8C4J6J2_DRONO